MQTISSINPVNGKEIKKYNLFSRGRVEEYLLRANESYIEWKKTTYSHRSNLLYKVADLLEKNAETYAEAITLEMGKTLISAISEIKKCAWVCRYYADNSASFLADKQISTDASKSYVTHQPLGIILAVMPWNFPFWQVFRFAAPTLMVGNVALLKHASNVSGSSLLIEKIFLEAGFPEHVFSSLIIKSSQVESIIANPLFKAISLTGSEVAGKAVASVAGKYIKKCVLELGGSDPYIILADADLDLTVRQCTQSRLLNSGQSCIGAKRFIVHQDIYDEFLIKFKAEMQKAKFGNPLDVSVDMGPMARFDLRNELHNQVIDSLKAGANCVLGGEIPELDGAFYPPTILTNVQKGMPAYEEELFGPVASVIRAKDDKEAVVIANDTSYGLGSCVFTRNLEKGERLAKYELQAGACFVNQFVKSDPRLPFGGIGSSGYGRELSVHGLMEFVNVKTVYVGQQL